MYTINQLLMQRIRERRRANNEPTDLQAHPPTPGETYNGLTALSHADVRERLTKALIERGDRPCDAAHDLSR